MIDDDDVEDAALLLNTASSLTSYLFLFVILVVLLLAYLANEDECSRLRCPQEQSPILIKNECLCVDRAK